MKLSDIRYMVSTEQKVIPEINFFKALISREDDFTMLSGSPQRYPELFTINFPARRLYIVHNPTLVQHILQQNHLNYVKDRGYRVLALLLGNGLVTNEDSTSWRKQRTLMQPSFHRESLQRISEVVVSSTERLLQSWKGKEGTVMNFTQEMAWLTIDIVSKALFTTDVTEADIKMTWRNINYLNDQASHMAKNPLHIPWQFPLPRYIKGRKYIAELDKLIYGIIQKRKQQENPPRDLLQLLMESRYEDTGEGMTDLQIRDELMTIYAAGHETTVNALSWTWYLIKQHADCEKTLHEESVKYAKDRNPAFADLPVLEYGKQVMNESMRLYPPVPAIGRYVIKEDGTNGYLFKAGSSTVINITGLHRHAAYWDKPSEFIPGRFKNFEVKGDNRFIFMPFGAGPRICIGNSFAMMEMQLINAMLSSRVEMELLSKDIKPVPMITLKPGEGVMMRLKKVLP